MDKIKIGDLVYSKHGEANVRGIDMVNPDSVFADDDDNISMQEIWACDKDRCVFELSNKHWSRGCDIQIITDLNSTECH